MKTWQKVLLIIAIAAALIGVTIALAYSIASLATHRPPAAPAPRCPLIIETPYPGPFDPGMHHFPGPIPMVTQ